MRRSAPSWFIGSFFGNRSGGASFSFSSGNGATNAGANGSASRGGGFMPDILGSIRRGEGVTGPFQNGDFGSIFDKALEWCSISHAQSIARRRNMDIRDIKFETLPDGKLRVMVDAPHATPQQIESLGEEVMQECPLAKFRKSQLKHAPEKQMEWKRLPDRYDR